ncbi:MAG: adenylate/guanylate cyclase domain-containing protein [Candidatus Binatales bacterium]
MSDTPTTNPTRELAAITFSDIVGYTAIIGRDEERAMRALAEHRALLRTLLPKFNGRMIGEIGDGTLSSFHSALDAANCAREVQASLEGKDEFRVRIGIHVGDVLFSVNDVHGDGVNVASRIHALAAPGGICISERVYEDVRNKPEIRVKDLGEKRLKNVDRPIRVYTLAATAPPEQPRTERTTRWTGRALVASAAVLLIAALGYGVARWRSSAPSSGRLATHARVIRSIAVLPLDNFTGDPNQEYFADGMTDELTTDLAKISALRVTSRGSVMRSSDLL